METDRFDYDYPGHLKIVADFCSRRELTAADLVTIFASFVFPFPVRCDGEFDRNVSDDSDLRELFGNETPHLQVFSKTVIRRLSNSSGIYGTTLDRLHLHHRYRTRNRVACWIVYLIVGNLNERGYYYRQFAR